MSNRKKQRELVQRYQDEQKQQSKVNSTIVGYFDGACEPKNPGGNMGIGACLKIAGVEVFSHSSFVKAKKDNSNNVAEYMAFETLLDWLQSNDVQQTKIHICGDSKLVIEQMQGHWQIKFGFYVPYALRCKEKMKGLRENNKLSFVLQWIPRTQNSYADELSKSELINHNVQFKIQPLTLNPNQ